MTTDEPGRRAPLGLSEILRRMAPPDLTNVSPLRPSCAPRAMTPEEALISWRLGLPEDADPAAAARDALALLGAGALPPPLARLRDYLTDAAAPERPRRKA